MRRVGAASLATVNPTARPARKTAAKDGDVTEMFAESIALPACIAPAAAQTATPDPALKPARAAWHERAARAIAARFRRTPREEPPGPDPRLERFYTRRSGADPSA